MKNKEEYSLCSLLFQTEASYSENLEVLLSLIEDSPDKSLIVAHEVCLSGFDYENLEDVNNFNDLALEKIKKVSQNKIIVFTIIQKINNKIFNMLQVIHNAKVIHTRAKARLFTFGAEDKYFTQGKTSEIEIIEIDGMKLAFLICFELRFKDLWQKCEGADIIVIPSWWGALRAEHFQSLTRALAIMNQCYVVASDGANDECSKMSGIITPMGLETRNGNSPCLRVTYEAQEIKKMRRYMNVGIK